MDVESARILSVVSLTVRFDWWVNAVSITVATPCRSQKRLMASPVEGMEHVEVREGGLETDNIREQHEVRKSGVPIEGRQS